MVQKEKVLCIQRSSLPKNWVMKKSIIKIEEHSFYDLCETAGFQWLDREKAERDPSYKQVIPYIILQTTDKKQTAVYRRMGSEKRLHDLWSIGIGGHINPMDLEPAATTFKSILNTGMNREIDEELFLSPPGLVPRFIGTINEEATDVGSVHFGAVFRILTPDPEQCRPGEELVDFQWMPTKTLGSLNLELWSELALKLLEE